MQMLGGHIKKEGAFEMVKILGYLIIMIKIPFNIRHKTIISISNKTSSTTKVE